MRQHARDKGYYLENIRNVGTAVELKWPDDRSRRVRLVYQYP